MNNTGLAALANESKRPKVFDAQMVTKLPSSVKTLIEEYADGQDKSAGAIVRLALLEFLERRGYNATREW